MSNRYFEKFPVINYKGVPAVNIMRRVGFNNKIKSFLNVFYQYTAEKDDTVDNLAFNYYKDVNFDWLIYHANDILDPYYDVWLSEPNFLEFIKNKYGSIEKAQRQIIYYKNNWEIDDRVISGSTYNALHQDLKKYWHPMLGVNNVIGYKRAKIDFIYSTNKIVSFDFTANTSEPFTINELVSITGDSSSYATVRWANTTSVVLKHLVGSIDANTTSLTGESSGIVASIDGSSFTNLIDYSESSYVSVNSTIPELEQPYYSPVSSYTAEEALNTKKRDIYLVDESNKSKLNKQLEKLMK